MYKVTKEMLQQKFDDKFGKNFYVVANKLPSDWMHLKRQEILGLLPN